MRPEIKVVSDCGPTDSVLFFAVGGEIPTGAELSPAERDYASRCIEKGDTTIHINRYERSIFFVSPGKDLPDWRSREEARKAACEVISAAEKNFIKELTIVGPDEAVGLAEAFVEGMLLGSYRFDRYKTTAKERELLPSLLKVVDSRPVDVKELRWSEVVAEAVYMARDLINEPVIKMNSTTFVNEVTSMGKSGGFRVEVLGKSRIEALRMGGLLAVNRGSIDPPAFMVLEWKPEDARNSNPLLFVGKGVMYDTGGMNVKPGSYMEGMKGDMAGAAAVASLLYVVAKCRLPIHVMALIPVTDNRVNGNAIVPGDIIRTHNGMSVEIVNTDAEGRLLLADALSYSDLFTPSLVVSIATITGSAEATFGTFAGAVMGNAEEEHFELLSSTGYSVYERVARLPFWHEYGEAMKSDIADLKNLGSRNGGAINAGKFLESFVKAPFIHIDIAGPAILKKDDHYRKKDGPGFGVRLLAGFCRSFSEKSGS